MRVEVKRWWRMAKDDLDSAKSNLKNKKYYVCAFLAQQAVEKALKALLLKKKKKLIKIHDLVILGREVGLIKQNSSEYLKIAEGILKWAERNI